MLASSSNYGIVSVDVEGQSAIQLRIVHHLKYGKKDRWAVEGPDQLFIRMSADLYS